MAHHDVANIVRQTNVEDFSTAGVSRSSSTHERSRLRSVLDENVCGHREARYRKDVHAALPGLRTGNRANYVRVVPVWLAVAIGEEEQQPRCVPAVFAAYDPF